MHPDDTMPCFYGHMGIWAIEPQWMRQALSLVQSGLYPMRSRDEMRAATPTNERLFSPSNGVAIVRVTGAISKYPSKFTETSAVLVRRAIGQALADEDIDGILLAIDSPGGQVEGIYEVGQAVARAATQKPVAAFIEDLGASAAYWIASQATRITANAPAMVGSIGVFAVLEDLSGVADRQGVRVIVKSTGPYKGAGVPGTPISQEIEDQAQQHVDQYGEFFFSAVQAGRKLNKRQMEAVTDGRVWIAAEAQQLGLIDGVGTFEEAFAWTQQTRRPRRVRSASYSPQGVTLTAAQRVAALAGYLTKGEGL